MTEFSFDLLIASVPIKFISKFAKYMTISYWKIRIFTGCATGRACLVYIGGMC